MNQNVSQEESPKKKERKKEPKPLLLNILQGKFGEKTSLVTATLLFMLALISVTSIHPVLSIVCALLAIVLARDVLIVYTPARAKKVESE